MNQELRIKKQEKHSRADLAGDSLQPVKKLSSFLKGMGSHLSRFRYLDFEGDYARGSPTRAFSL
jgi:hypothetical protein